jgi:hypothetical protein
MTTNSVIIHVRFAPDGSVSEIGERPASLSPRQWFDRLCDKYPRGFQALAGGRGVYRVAPAEVEALKAAALQ